MTFHIDGGAIVLKDELTKLFIQMGEIFLGKFHKEDDSPAKIEWITWIFIFVFMGFSLNMLRQKGFIPTFDKNSSLEQEVEREQMKSFTKQIILKDDLTSSEIAKNVETYETHSTTGGLSLGGGNHVHLMEFPKLMKADDSTNEDLFIASKRFATSDAFGCELQSSPFSDTPKNKMLEISFIYDPMSSNNKTE